jgi:hypothetical protein
MSTLLFYHVGRCFRYTFRFYFGFERYLWSVDVTMYLQPSSHHNSLRKSRESVMASP